MKGGVDTHGKQGGPTCVPVCGWCVSLSPIVPSTCVPALDTRGLAFPCLPLSPVVSPHVCLCWMVCPPSRGLVWHCLPSCLPLLDGIPAFPRSCLPLSSLVSPCLPLCPIVSAHVWLWWKVCSPSWGEVLSLVSPHVCLCWMAWPPSRGLVSPCLLFSPIVSPHVCLCWMVSPPSEGLVSHCVPACFLLLDGVSAFPLVSPCLPLSPFLFPFVGWCVFPRPCLPCLPACLPAQLVSQLASQLVPKLFRLSSFLFPFGVRLPEALFPLPPFPACLRACFHSCFPFLGGVWAFPRPCLPCLPACLPACLPSCFPLLDGVSAFPLVSHCLASCFLCWMVCPPSRALVPLVSQLVYQFVFLFPFVGWCAHLPEVLSPLSPSLSPSLSSSLSPRLSPSLSSFLFRCVGWCVLPACLPACLPSCFPLLDGVSAFPLVSHCLASCFLCWMVCPPSRALVPLVSQLVCQFVFLFPFVGWCAHLPEVLSPLSPSLSPSLSSSLSPRLSPSLSSFLFRCVGWCVRLPEALSPLSPSLSPSLSPTLSLPSLPAKVIARRELRRLWSSQSTGIENDVIYHFHPSMFSTHPTWQSCAAWFARLDPNSCTPVGCFLHRFLASSAATSKRSRTK